MNKDVKDLVDAIASGKKANIRESLDKVISEKAIDALEVKKVHVAKSFFGKKE